MPGSFPARRLAVLSGATGGIGRATARELANRGWSLGLVGRDSDRLEGVLADTGAEGSVLAVDLKEPVSAAAAAQDFLARHGPPDALIAAHGIARWAPALETEPSELAEVVRVNLCGTVALIQAFVPAMLERGSGSVLAVLSIAAHRIFPGWAAYTASKFALLGWIRTLREEIRGRGVQVSVLAPGATSTPLWDNIPGEWDRSRMLSSEEVARTIAWILEAANGVEIEELTLVPRTGPL